MRITLLNNISPGRYWTTATVELPEGVLLFWERNQRTLRVQHSDGTVVAAFAGIMGFHTDRVTAAFQGVAAESRPAGHVAWSGGPGPAE